MDRTVCVRFYQVSRHRNNDQGFSECLEEIFATRNGEWIELDQDIHVRLERVHSEGAFIKGEFARKQTVNLPPKAQGHGSPLQPNPDPIAHRAAFQYHPGMGIIAIETNRNGMSLSRINGYIKEILDHPGFIFLPAPTRQAWDRFADCIPRGITVKVAHPENLGVVEGPANTLAQNIRSMKDTFGGPVVEVSVNFGRQREGALNKRNIVGAVRGLLQQQQQGAQIEKIQIKADGESEPIDLLIEQMKEKETLHLDDHNLEDHYATRRSFIERAFQTNMNSIREVYDQAA